MRELEPGSIFLNRYLIERELGAGASALVYAARDTLQGDFAVVIKYGLHEGDEWSVEAAHFRRLYPELFLSSGSDEHGYPYIVTRRLEGATAAELTDLAPAAVEAVMAELLVDLAELHRQGVLHNDVRARNVLLSPDKARLLDFGGASMMLTQPQMEEYKAARAALDAREVDNSAPSAELLRRWYAAEKRWRAVAATLGSVGDDAYLAPEAFDEDYKRRPLDASSDLYSLGASIYRMLLHKAPAKCGPQVYSARVPAQLAAAIDRAMACDKNERYPSARAMLADLRPDLRRAVDATVVDAGRGVG